MTTPRFANGVMTITLAGIDFDLQANVRASRAICRHFKGLTDAYTKVNNYDFDSVVTIINAATGRTNADADATAEAVFAHGFETVGALVVMYLTFLSRGGKPPSGLGDGDSGTAAAEGKADATGEAA